jgi:hypothetical protein
MPRGISTSRPRGSTTRSGAACSGYHPGDDGVRRRAARGRAPGSPSSEGRVRLACASARRARTCAPGGQALTRCAALPGARDASFSRQWRVGRRRGVTCRDRLQRHSAHGAAAIRELHRRTMPSARVRSSLRSCSEVFPGGRSALRGLQRGVSRRKECVAGLQRGVSRRKGCAAGLQRGVSRRRAAAARAGCAPAPGEPSPASAGPGRDAGARRLRTRRPPAAPTLLHAPPP